VEFVRVVDNDVAAALRDVMKENSLFASRRRLPREISWRHLSNDSSYFLCRVVPERSCAAVPLHVARVQSGERVMEILE
jgi:hypothetical protein